MSQNTICVKYGDTAYFNWGMLLQSWDNLDRGSAKRLLQKEQPHIELHKLEGQDGKARYIQCFDAHRLSSRLTRLTPTRKAAIRSFFKQYLQADIYGDNELLIINTDLTTRLMLDTPVHSIHAPLLSTPTPDKYKAPPIIPPTVKSNTPTIPKPHNAWYDRMGNWIGTVDPTLLMQSKFMDHLVMLSLVSFQAYYHQDSITYYYNDTPPKAIYALVWFAQFAIYTASTRSDQLNSTFKGADKWKIKPFIYFLTAFWIYDTAMAWCSSFVGYVAPDVWSVKDVGNILLRSVLTCVLPLLTVYYALMMERKMKRR